MSEVLIVPHPLLRQASKALNKVTKDDVKLSKKMIKIMKKAPGVGLAANQIGVLKKIVTVHIQDKEKETDKVYALFNPIIMNSSKETIVLEEGCLSLPKQFADIERPQSITLRYMNENNKIIEEKKDGIEARILQHEIDHLSGKLFVDYLSSLKRNILIKKVQKLKKMGEI
jgi:peptide deformylase